MDIDMGKYLGSLGKHKDLELAKLYSALSDNLKTYFEQRGTAVWSSPDPDTQGFEIRKHQTQESVVSVIPTAQIVRLSREFSHCAPVIEEVVRNTVRDFPRLLADERRRLEGDMNKPLQSLPSGGHGC